MLVPLHTGAIALVVFITNQGPGGSGSIMANDKPKGGKSGSGKTKAGEATASDTPDGAEDLEDEFAAFEREAREAAAKAMGTMGGGAAASAKSEPKAETPAPADDTASGEDDQEDEFAAFEREAREAAAKAMGTMGGGAAGTETDAQTSAPAGADPGQAAAEGGKAAVSDEQGEAAGQAGAEESPAKAAATAAAAKTVAAKRKEIFGPRKGIKSQTVLVVGGGIAGITAAIEIAETGFDVVLLEQGPALGGRVTRLNLYFPKMCHPNCGLEINYQRIRNNRRLKVMTMSQVLSVAGKAGDYKVKVRTRPTYTTRDCNGCGECAKVVKKKIPNRYNYGRDKMAAAYLPHEHAFPMRYVIDPGVKGTADAKKLEKACPAGAIDFGQEDEEFELNAGAIVWATGWRPYDARKLEVYSYGHSPDIINNVEMERLASHDGPSGGKILRPSNGKEVKKVALIQCAGSRDINHLPYCSMICCLASLKHAAYVREQHGDAEVDIYYIDIRAHDKMSQFYERVRQDEKIKFIKSKPGHIDIGEDGRPVLCGERTIDREIYAEPYDLVVLATGMEPSLNGSSAPDGISRDEYGFVVDDGGQFSAGVAGGPFDVALSTQSATAAALKAIQAVRGGVS